MNLEVIPLLVLTLLLISTGRPDVDRAELLLSGRHELAAHHGALIVGDATVEVPGGAEVAGPVYLIGGDMVIAGTVEGDVHQLAGRLTVTDTATIGGQLRHIAGMQSVGAAATVARRTGVDLVPRERGPVARYLPLALVALVLALVGARRERRNPSALQNMGDAAVRHPLVSLVVGALISVTAISLFVFMSFTLVLIPVALLGLAVGLLALAYGVVVVGHLIGQRLRVARPGLATGLGVVVAMLGLQVAGSIPLLGTLVVPVVLLTALGAVLITYFGLQEFKPPVLPD